MTRENPRARRPLSNWILALIVTAMMLVTLAFAACSNDNTDTGGATGDRCDCWVGQTIGGEAIEACTVRTDDQGRKDCDCQFGGGAQTTQAICP